MSSRRASLRKRAVPASEAAAPGMSTAQSARAERKRGPRQAQPADFQVTLDIPESVPILERELRAIVILLGGELQDLLGS